MCCSWGHVDRLVTRRIWLKHRAIYSGEIIVPENNTLWKLWKKSREISELYSCQTTHLKFKNSYQRLNWTADHVNAMRGLNMKTKLRYGQTPSPLCLASLAHSNDVFGLEPCWCNSTHLNVLCGVSRKTPTWLSETLQRCTVNPSSSKLNKCVAKFS